jgi:hypothetical protein
MTRRMLTCTRVQPAMTRHYVRKTAKRDPATEKAAIEDYYRLKDANSPAPLKNAAFNRVKENTLCTWVKGHATAEAALAAYEERRKQGGQTHLPAAVEAAIGKVIYAQWSKGLTPTPEQVIAMATIEAERLGLPWKVRFFAASCQLGFCIEALRQNASGCASKDWYARFCKSYRLSGARHVNTRTKNRSAAETKAAIQAFFKGTTLTVEVPDGVKTFNLPGYEAAVDRVWWEEASGAKHTYRTHPERMGNLDEALLAELAGAKACAPTGARHVNCQGGGQPQSVTVLSGATLAGDNFDDVFAWEGTCTSVNAMKYAPGECRAITRPDGYMMTWEGWLKVLENLRAQVKGALAQEGFGRRTSAR